MRKDGYYWVKEQGEWEIAYYGLLGWTWIAMEQFGYDPLVVHEDEDTPFDEVGPRIPFPDGRL